jgi:alpha-galactosidase
LDYVGGDEALSDIERDKLSLQEVKGCLKDHMPVVKDAMKFHFLMPGRELVNGFLFLFDDAGCMQMSDHTTEGGVADVYVEYQGEQSDGGESSGSDFEDEIINLGDNSEDEVPEVITAEDYDSVATVGVDQVEPEAILDNVLVPDDSGVISQVQNSLGKRIKLESDAANTVCEDLVPRDASNSEEKGEEDSDSEDDNDYVAHSDDSGEESEVMQLRKKAKQFKRKIRASQRWVEGENATGAIPIDLAANVEEVLEEINKEDEFESFDEDYSYDEEDGNLVRRKSRYPRFDPETEIPRFGLSMVFRSKRHLVKAVKRYGLVTKRSLSFKKSEVDRVRVKCDWPNCPWLLYAAKTTRCSRFQIITYDYDHHCAQNRDNHLVTAKVIAKKYEHFILANPTWKIESMKSTVLQDFFADVSTSKCKAAKKIVMDKLLSGMKGEYNKVFDY